MNSKFHHVGIFSLILSIAILGNVYITSSGQSANITQDNTSFTNNNQDNMTEQTLSSEETAQVIRESSAIRDEQENENEINNKGN